MGQMVGVQQLHELGEGIVAVVHRVVVGESGDVEAEASDIWHEGGVRAEGDHLLDGIAPGGQRRLEIAQGDIGAAENGQQSGVCRAAGFHRFDEGMRNLDIPHGHESDAGARRIAHGYPSW